MTVWQLCIMIGSMALATFATRVLPFLLFPSGRTTPEYVLYLGRVLPFAITGMLIVFCLKDVNPLQSPFGIPEMICIVAVFAVHRITHKSMPAIAAGTLLYMALIRIFPML